MDLITNKSSRCAYKFTLNFLLCLSIFFSSWVARKFNTTSFYDFWVLVYSIVDGVVKLDVSSQVFLSFLRSCLAPSFAICFFIFYYERFLRSEISGFVGFSRAVREDFLTAFYFFGSVLYFLFKNEKLPILILVVSAVFFMLRISFVSYAVGWVGVDYFSSNYVDPKDVNISRTGSKKNLIWIYVESFENAYRNTEIFGKDLLGSLDARRIGGG